MSIPEGATARPAAGSDPDALEGRSAAWFTRELIALLVVLGLLSIGNGLLNPSLATLVSTSAEPEPRAPPSASHRAPTVSAGRWDRQWRRRCTPRSTGRRSSPEPSW